MALEDYKRKRDFTKTPEPAGDVKAKGSGEPLFFCVQKHLASHLHYDFRLEFQGVLLSWAVPKGPSIDTRDKRLAMQTEDHPYDYGMFEGVIPEGYGAGIVMLWDYGTWEPESDDIAASLKKGDLKFRLNGFKLKGSWVLVKTRGYGGAPNSWLLIKHKDEWAGPVDITDFAPLSVKTPDADFAEILSGRTPDIWHSHAPAKGGDTGAMFKKVIERAMSMSADAAKSVSVSVSVSSNTKNTKNTKAKTLNTKIQKAKASTTKAKAAKTKSKAAPKPKTKTARKRI